MIPVNTPLLNGNEKKYLEECIETSWISSEGPFVKRFEKDMAEYVGRDHGIAVSSGSAALDVAVSALNLEKGAEVIAPTFTIISPIQSIIKAGLKPVLIDADPQTFNINISLMEEKISPKTKAILVVHIYGLPVDMDPILDLAKKYNLRIIEDAAEVHGQTYKGKKCGSFGDISIFSFYPNKHITCGEGGMVLTDDDELATRSRELRNLCFKGPRRFIHDDLGWNYRMTNMQAALGCAQLENIEQAIKKKRRIGKLYNELIDPQYVQKPVISTDSADNIYWVYSLVVKENYLREEEFPADYFCKKLGELKIGTRPFFYPMHQQPIFHNMGLFSNEVHPVAESISRRGFYLPSGLGITEEEQVKVAEVCNEISKSINS
ncbi:DegT/DnrJ/EryC1/StrS family aminotransferase [Lentisphaera profundi]|uniref:DegT/DnrJ/EryC1/StrS family aminotransferase n=1 Tax=Lentisphaera profundi TaxID=1658616 RepID=A0ABY7VRN7_9BACT|nr:DegT/DnrJ/EryC1/StrS family aminotransferase [Lentisphaera profundi]WDE95969.1 DegT/DnrJ/EryC1/StrS family aminotransferase [Lentisphaera profundi]